MSSNIQVPIPVNEPVFEYRPGSPEREQLKSEIKAMSSDTVEIPAVIGGEEIRTGETVKAVMPHRHGHLLGEGHRVGPKEVERAVQAAADAHREWSSWDWVDRAAIFLKAADLLATTWRPVINAATMLCQSKTVHQAEIDAAAELADFFRFNVHFAERLYEEQPISPAGQWNRVEYRPLEGFVYAVTPFNFTSIAGNLPSAPAIMGNTVVWKPATSTVYTGYLLQRLFEAAGLPPGVINFVPGNAGAVSDVLLNHPSLAGIHFTGSTEVFHTMWRTVGENIARYKSYPRLVGETGGKDFIIAHPSADPAALKTAIVRGGFEYQGQKCSAVSRVYIPRSIWQGLKDDLLAEVDGIKMGDPTDFTNFMGAVIDRNAFTSITEYIEFAKQSSDAEILAGGEYDDSEGFFIRPTIIEAKRPDFKTMCEEIFGPVVTIHVYEDDKWEETLELVNSTSPYALTGAVFATDRAAVRQANKALRFAAGNFYVNDKPTGAVVGQQPFGGGRASGTNDKAGSMLNLIRWASTRTIKETSVPDTDYRYPFMEG
ncbi:MAG: L-glutamate gamma-semialdehyde dehydrogenase [Gemmatimonadota bacterium]|nr:L-glutamate gamma-semialdehyde dehydrogenase [Gemmatimonadota bacterium]MDH5803536.1 L-glutamate gamma-semialdehyde dehydrogenase [Gemmatimonadota bacterium]